MEWNVKLSSGWSGNEARVISQFTHHKTIEMHTAQCGERRLTNTKLNG